MFAAARRLVPALSERDIITSFSGLRPTLPGDDFLIQPSAPVPAFVQVAGIQSPGLTAAPAMGEYVKDLLKKAGLALEEKPDWNPASGRAPHPRAHPLPGGRALARGTRRTAKWSAAARAVSEAEIVAAIRRGHRTLDGIKFYTRAQMGRCQGGFCTYRILRILARETGLPLEASPSAAGPERAAGGPQRGGRRVRTATSTRGDRRGLRRAWPPPSRSPRPGVPWRCWSASGSSAASSASASTPASACTCFGRS